METPAYSVPSQHILHHLWLPPQLQGAVAAVEQVLSDLFSPGGYKQHHIRGLELSPPGWRTGECRCTILEIFTLIELKH